MRVRLKGVTAKGEGGCHEGNQGRGALLASMHWTCWSFIGACRILLCLLPARPAMQKVRRAFRLGCTQWPKLVDRQSLVIASLTQTPMLEAAPETAKAKFGRAGRIEAKLHAQKPWPCMGAGLSLRGRHKRARLWTQQQCLVAACPHSLDACCIYQLLEMLTHLQATRHKGKDGQRAERFRSHGFRGASCERH